MKQIYIVMGRDYYKRPIMAYETRNDAVKSACAVHECDASEAADYIRAVHGRHAEDRRSCRRADGHRPDHQGR